jgi:hypothetical protein
MKNVEGRLMTAAPLEELSALALQEWEEIQYGQASCGKHTPHLEALEEAVSRVAAGIRKFAMAAPRHAGHDCYVLKDLAGRVFLEWGFEVQLMSGFAAWRVWPGPDEVIGHIAHGVGTSNDPHTGASRPHPPYPTCRPKYHPAHSPRIPTHPRVIYPTGQNHCAEVFSASSDRARQGGGIG